jgi:peroxiredoxin
MQPYRQPDIPDNSLMMKRKTLVTLMLLCLGIGLTIYYRVQLMPPAIQLMKDRQLEHPSEYEPLNRDNSEKQLPTFRLADTNGVFIDSSDLSGKLVLLQFWTTWCTTCVAEMPAMEKLHQRLKNRDVAVVAVNIKEPLSQVKNFVSTHKLTFMTLLDTDGEITKRLNVFAIPTTFIYGKSGQLLDTVIGWHKWDGRSSISSLNRLIDAGDNVD